MEILSLLVEVCIEGLRKYVEFDFKIFRFCHNSFSVPPASGWDVGGYD